MHGLRPSDTIQLQTPVGVLDVFESFTVTNTITQASEATFSLGDETAGTILSAIPLGAPCAVLINGKPALRGRLISQEPNLEAVAGCNVELALETIIGAGQSVSADPDQTYQTITLRAFLLALYSRIYTSNPGWANPIPQIQTNYSLERDLLTGRPTKGGAIDASIEMVLGQQVKAQPPETIYDSAAKALRRFSTGHWDTPNGDIFVGKPDESQVTVGRLQLKRGPASVANNILRVRVIRDWRGVPSVVRTHGILNVSARAFLPILGEAEYVDVSAAYGYRPVVVKGNIVGENLAQANAQARRELATRSKRKDGLEVEVDGLSWWDGVSSVPYAPNTTWDVDLDILGGISGVYLCLSVTRRRDPRRGDTTTLQLVHIGTFTF